MIKEYIKAAVRTFAHQGVYSWISLLGLTIGLTVAALITVVVLHAAAFDRYHPDVDRLYRIAHEVKVNDRLLRFPLTPGPLMARLKQCFAGVESACRLQRRTEPIVFGASRFLEDRFLYADPEFTDMFALHFISGSASSALRFPHSVVLTAGMATKYFGDQMALGKTLTVAGEPYRVTGVVADISRDSHLAFDFLSPLTSLARGEWSDRWSAHNFYTYIKLRPGYRATHLQRELDLLVNRELGPQFAAALGKSFDEFRRQGQRFSYFLQPVADIYLDSHLEHELRPNGDRRLVTLLAVLAGLILTISCFNYINFATAQAATRALEIGVRKAFGAERGQLVVQFLTETLLTTFAAAGLAILLLWLLHRGLQAFLGELMPYSVAIGPRTILLGAASLVALALAAGGYPAAILSTLAPRGLMSGGNKGGAAGGVRRVLIALQFAVAIALLVVTLVVKRQLRFIANKDLGFQPAGVLVVDGLGLLGDRWQGFEQEALRIPGVVAASAASFVPGRPITKGYLYPGSSTREEDLVTTAVLEADAGFVDTLALRMLEGRAFTAAETEVGDVVLVNSMIPERLGWATPVGRLVTVGKVPAPIRGVFANVYLESLRNPPQEMVVRPLLGARPRVLAVRIAPGAARDVLARLASCWRTFAPDEPFDAGPLDQQLAVLYAPERRLMGVIGGFAATAAALACLGIAGLSVFAAAQRTREVAIRKAIGASSIAVACLLTCELVGPVLIGFVMAVPLGWHAANRWLQGFASRIDMPWSLFAWAGLAITAVALFAVGTQSLRAALANPAESLRHE
jgi:putative ABC transport system permease protein